MFFWRTRHALWFALGRTEVDRSGFVALLDNDVGFGSDRMWPMAQQFDLNADEFEIARETV